jgi:hypothetical protein
MPGKKGKIVIEDGDLEAYLAACKVGPEASKLGSALMPQATTKVTLKHISLAPPTS